MTLNWSVGCCCCYWNLGRNFDRRLCKKEVETFSAISLHEKVGLADVELVLSWPWIYSVDLDGYNLHFQVPFAFTSLIYKGASNCVMNSSRITLVIYTCELFEIFIPVSHLKYMYLWAIWNAQGVPISQDCLRRCYSSVVWVWIFDLIIIFRLKITWIMHPYSIVILLKDIVWLFSWWCRGGLKASVVMHSK